MLGKHKLSLPQRLKLADSARNTGSNTSIKISRPILDRGQYLPKLTDKLLTPYLRD
jgi:hypothetical protein